MKKISLIFVILLFLSSCNNLFLNNKEAGKFNCTVNGKLSGVKPSGGLGRSATSSFEADSVYVVKAFYLDDESESAEAISGSVNQENLNWTITLNKKGKWKIEAFRLAKTDSQDILMKGQIEITVSDLGKDSSIECDPLPLFLNDSLTIPGAIGLEISSSITSVRKVKYHCNNCEDIEDGEITFADGKALFKLENLTSNAEGYYDFSFSFFDVKDNCLYSCCEIVEVFPGFTTNIWTGNSPYINNGKFVLNASVTEGYKDINNYDYPIILYDRDRLYKHKEFENPRPGLYAFSSFDEVSDLNNAKEYLGFNLKKFYDFVIDPVTQILYNHGDYPETFIYYYPTLLYEPSNFYDICRMYEDTNISRDQDRVLTMTVYDGVVYAVTSNGHSYNLLQKITAEDSVFMTILDSEGNEISTSFNSNRIIAYKNYLYVFYSDYDLIGCKKYLITDNQIKELSSVSKYYTNELNNAAGNNFGINGNTIFSRNITLADLQMSEDGSRIYIAIRNRDVNINGGVPYYYNHGGILTLKTDNADDSMDFVSLDGSSNLIYGWYSKEDDDAIRVPEEEDDKYFYGPGKFLARKPKELILSDEGGWAYEDDGEIHNKNRVVRVDLETFAMEVKDVEVGFDAYIKGNQLGSYLGSGYY